MNFIQEVLKYGAEKAFAKEYVDSEVAKARYSICQKACTLYDSENDKCMMCGCFMEVKTKCKIHYNAKKLRTEVTHCPGGKWGEEDKEIANHYREIDGLTELE